MKILASRQFTEEARRAPAPLLQVLPTLAQARGEQAPYAARVSPDRILGMSRDSQALKLHFYVSPQEMAPPPEPPLAGLARSELRQWGVPDELLEFVQRLQQAEQIAGLALPEQVKATLLFRFIEQTQSPPDREMVRCAPDSEYMADFLKGHLPDLLLNLDPSQERVVNLGLGGTIVLRGVAGSGKTSVILRRIHRLMKASGSSLQRPQILVLTYNRSLATASRELLSTMGGDYLREVDVQTLHRWCFGFTKVTAGIVTNYDRQRLIEKAVAQVESVSAHPDSKLWKYPISFWEEEIHRIQGRVTEGRTQYLGMVRHGAQHPLDNRLREMVCDVYEAYQAECHRTRRMDWDDVVRLAYDQAVTQGGQAPRYDYVFVDEAQDLTMIALKLAALLARSPGELFVTFDVAQSIYERVFRWKDAGIVVHGARSIALNRNFRNTRQIMDVARKLLSAVHKEHHAHEGDEADVLVPETDREGVAPRHLPCARSGEADAIAAEIKRLLLSGRVRAGNVAVLVYPNKIKHAIFMALKETHGLPCQEHDFDSEIRLADPSVKVMPMKSAKGLEFPVVFLVATGRLFQPSAKMDEKEAAAFRSDMRRVLYVAMTRAMAELVLVYPESDPPQLLGVEAPPAQKHLPSQSRAEDPDQLLEPMYKASGVGWDKFLRQVGLPTGIGIRRDMTLGEARRFAARKGFT